MPVKIDVISGFLGAGKTTLINRILEGISGTDQVAVIENEFGEIGIDGHRFSQSGVILREISGGCICCSLFGDFVSAACKLISQVRPKRIIVEPTGVGKLTDVLKALEAVGKTENIEINMVIAVVDPLRYELYSKMFGDFFKNQIQTAATIFLSRTQISPKESVENAIDHIKDQNQNANIIARSWDELTGTDIVSIGEAKAALNSSQNNDTKGLHYHHADKALKVWSICTAASFSKQQFKHIIHALESDSRFGEIVRGKGFFQTPEGNWIQYSYVPGETCFEKAVDMDTGKILFIGKELNSSRFEKLFGLYKTKGVLK